MTNESYLDRNQKEVKDHVQGHAANRVGMGASALELMIWTTLLNLTKYTLASLFTMKTKYYNQFPQSKLTWKVDMFDWFSKINARSSSLLHLTLLAICGTFCILL